MNNDLEYFELEWMFGTDFEKFKMLFDEIGIKYEESCHDVKIKIIKDQIEQTYENALYINFDCSGEFVNFETCGG